MVKKSVNKSMTLNLINNALNYPRSIADWDYLDRSFPPMPLPLWSSPIHQDPVLEMLLENEYNKYHAPKYVKGLDIPINCEGEWKCPALKYLNQFYAMESARIIDDFNDPFFCVNVIMLGGGWRVHVGGADLLGKRSEKDNFGLWWLYQKKSTPKPRPDGIQRLRKLILQFNQMPNNPYSAVVLKPVGHEMLIKYSKFLEVTEYKQDPRATTDALIKMYARKLKAVKTMMPDKDGGYWYRADLYDPIDPLYSREDSHSPEVFQNYDDNLK